MSVSVSMPQLGESVTEGTVTRWLKREGDHVDADEPLLEVSTDKVDTEVPSPVSGILRGITVAEDETVAVGAELAVIDEDGASGGQAAAETPAPSPAAEQPPAEPPAQQCGRRRGSARPPAARPGSACSAAGRRGSGAAGSSRACGQASYEQPGYQQPVPAEPAQAPDYAAPPAEAGPELRGPGVRARRGRRQLPAARGGIRQRPVG